jgi:predicted TIM-barrel fold metal-dependent hydrolase
MEERKMKWEIISTDSHLIEPPDVWTTRIDARFRDRAPKVVRDGAADWWIVDGVRLGFVHGPRKHDAISNGHPSTNLTFEDIRTSAYMPDEYVKENLDDGIIGSIVCPTYGLLMYGVQDRALLSAICRAYNDWISDFCKANPNRLKGVAMVNNFIVADAVRELERAKTCGLAAGMISVWPGMEHSYGKPEYEELWTAAESLGMPLCMHMHSNHDAPYGVPSGQSTPTHCANVDLWIRMSLGDMIFGGIFERHPKLKVVSAENEGGWLPYFISQMDWVYWERLRPNGRRPEHGTIPRAPSTYFRENVLVSIIHDRSVLEARYQIGVNNILWGSDYPHDQSTYPHSRAAVASLLAGVASHEAECILLHNAADLFGLNVPELRTSGVATMSA